jgi:hypothetical protein
MDDQEKKDQEELHRTVEATKASAIGKAHLDMCRLMEQGHAGQRKLLVCKPYAFRVPDVRVTLQGLIQEGILGPIHNTSVQICSLPFRIRQYQFQLVLDRPAGQEAASVMLQLVRGEQAAGAPTLLTWTCWVMRRKFKTADPAIDEPEPGCIHLGTRYNDRWDNLQQLRGHENMLRLCDVQHRSAYLSSNDSLTFIIA